MEIIDERPTLTQIVRRNIPEGSPPPLVALTREDWKRV